MLLETPGAMAAGLAYTALLLVIAWGDAATRRIPNTLVAALALAGLVASATVLHERVGLVGALAGMLLGFALWLPLWLVRAVGAGDVKLVAALGAWLGVGGVIDASVLAALAGGLLAIGVLVRRRAVGRIVSDLGFWFGALRIGGMSGAMAARPTPRTHGRSVLPYGIALAAGGLLAGWMPATSLMWLPW